MWKYIRKYLIFAILAGLFMVGEVIMDLIQPNIMSKIVDEGVLGINHYGLANMNLIWMLGVQMIAIALLGGLFGSLNNVFVHLSGQNIGNEMRKDCFHKVMTLSFPQIEHFGTGSIITRITTDINQVQVLVSTFVRGMIRTMLLTFGSLYCMFRLHATFGLVALCAFPFLVGTIALCLSKANPLFGKLQVELDRINAIMQEDISGIRIIKACVREVYEKVRFGKANEDLIKTQFKTLVIFSFMNPTINALMYVVIAVILWVGANNVNGTGTTPGNIMAAITYTTQLLNGILMMVMLFQNISRGLVSWKRVKEILNTASNLVDGSFEGETDKKGEIEFRNVSFIYPSTNRNVLSNINLTIHKGETLAIIGSTGCGKSTLVNLIDRFYDVTEGAILIDGIDIREYKQEALRKKISITLQKSELFSLSIRENIKWGFQEASDEDVKAAACTAQADEFISRTPNGYDTVVAERGMSLSGGQKQRLSIARSILKPAEIYIFDDSTSALDLKTEANVYQGLQKSKPESTKIIVAQRIASVRLADRIIVLENGKISACGTHEELMQSCPIYQDIYQSQIGKEEDIA